MKYIPKIFLEILPGWSQLQRSVTPTLQDEMEETLEQRETTAAGKLYWAKRNCKVITALRSR